MLPPPVTNSVFFLPFFNTPKKLDWWGWGFKVCRHISGKHQSSLYKTKSIAFEQETFNPTKSKHPNPLFLGSGAPGASTKSKSWKSNRIYRYWKLGSDTPSKFIPKQLDFVGKPLSWLCQFRLLGERKGNTTKDTEGWAGWRGGEKERRRARRVIVVFLCFGRRVTHDGWWGETTGHTRHTAGDQRPCPTFCLQRCVQLPECVRMKYAVLWCKQHRRHLSRWMHLFVKPARQHRNQSHKGSPSTAGLRSKCCVETTECCTPDQAIRPELKI